MQAYSKPVRQQWACGYELAPENGLVEAWSGLGYKGDPPTVCPGYTTTLPETIEIARAWRWWDKGSLDSFCDREPINPALKIGIELFAGAVASFERWAMTPADKGGGNS